jgi:threonine/homoserine/homoserine lactone efflux protein
MLDHVDLPIVLGAALIAVASPGPSILAIVGTSMDKGRRHGLLFATGVSLGSLTWSIAAALGLGAVMLADLWAFEALRWAGGLYLLWLAWRSTRSALRPAASTGPGGGPAATSRLGTVLAGWGLHLTNPKAILFIGSLYALGVPAEATAAELVLVVTAVCLQSAVIFHTYALIFSDRRVADVYLRFRRVFDGLFAVAFGLAGLKLLTARLR